MATGEAHAQMDPAVIHCYTFFADSGDWFHIADLIEMGAG
jgi:hypothetical protein